MSQYVATYDFDPQGRVTSVLVADGWPQRWGADEFGFEAMRALLEQRAAHLAAPAGASADAQVPVSARSDMMAQALGIIRDANDLIAEALRQPQAPPLEETVSDPHRHVVVTLTNGAVAWIEVNQSWLRHADTGAVEADLLTALAAADAAASPAVSGLTTLAQRHRALVQQHDDFRRR